MKFVLTYVVLIYYTMSEISPELIRSVDIPKYIIYDIDFDRRGVSGAYIYIYSFFFSFYFSIWRQARRDESILIDAIIFEQRCKQA